MWVRRTCGARHQLRVAHSSSCFNWFGPGDQSRGQGEALSVKQMVDHAVARFGVDAGRVFVTGLSAGGAMTAVMLAAYPDVFRGGAVIAGIAYKCATTLVAGVLCLSQRQNRTPQQWGDLVRGAHPGYAGPRPDRGPCRATPFARTTVPRSRCTA